MFGSNVIDIGIGLILTYLILSLTVTATNELLANLSRSRAVDLERAIRNLLDGTSALPLTPWQKVFRFAARRDTPTPGPWSEAFFQHQLINALSKDGQKPSYVPPQTFATVLMYLVQSALYAGGDLLAPPAAAAGGNGLAAGGQPAAGNVPAPPAQPVGGNVPPPPAAPLRPPMSGLADFGQIRSAIEQVNNPTIRAVLLPLVEEARADLTDHISAMKKVSERIEIWYEHAMDRVTGWYTRRAQWFSFFIALAFAVLLNIDSVKITRCLAKDTTLRNSLLAMAQKQTAPPHDGAKKDVADDFKQVEQAMGRLDDLGIPLGWPDFCKKLKTLPCSFQGFSIVVTKLLGLLLTAFAAALGAPFWFDVLNKIVNVRWAGKAPEK